MAFPSLTWVAGGSGLVGRELLAQLADRPVLALVRRPLAGLARPSLLDGERESLGQPRRAAEAWTLRLARPVASLIPKTWRPITADRVARAMRLALDQPGPAVQLLESGAMQTLGAP